jgi:dephospho-CoA kinase
MIIALTGPLCSGKATLALYLHKNYGFKIVSLYELFALELGAEEGVKVSPEIIERFFAGKLIYQVAIIIIDECIEKIKNLYARELLKLRTDWTEKYVVYPFLPNQEMEQYM